MIINFGGGEGGVSTSSRTVQPKNLCGKEKGQIKDLQRKINEQALEIENLHEELGRSADKIASLHTDLVASNELVHEFTEGIEELSEEMMPRDMSRKKEDKTMIDAKGCTDDWCPLPDVASSTEPSAQSVPPSTLPQASEASTASETATKKDSSESMRS